MLAAFVGSLQWAVGGMYIQLTAHCKLLTFI